MSIERKALSALKWATAAKLVVQIVSWAGTLVVVRLLTPVDYGLMAKVAVVCSIASAIAELGLGASVIRSGRLAAGELRSLCGVTLLFGLCITALLVLASPLLALVFREPRLTWPIAVAATEIAISAAVIIPKALATRELAFRFLARIEILAGMASMIATLLLALAGAGVWALVLGVLLGALVRAAALLLRGERIRPQFKFRHIGEHIKFGLTLVGNRVGYFVIVQSDVLLGSLLLSTTEIGQYAVALQLATLPMSKIMGILNDVTLPTVAQQQHDRARVRSAVLKAIGLIALVAVPVLLGISAVAPELVRVLFGANWLDATPALVILPLIVPLRMVCSVLFTTSLALGNRQLDLRNTVANFALIPTGFFVGAHWGVVGLSLAWLVAVPLAYAVSLPAVLRFIGISWLDFVAQCCPPLLAAGAMYAAVYGLRTAADGLSPIVALLGLVICGAVVYAIAIAVVARNHLKVARTFARSLFARGEATA